jgi:hypothetical protein
MGIGAANGRTQRRIGSVRGAFAVVASAVMTGRSFRGLERRQLARCIALGQNLNGEVRAIALAQTAANAVRGLDDGVVRQDEAVLRADLDADVAALAPLINPSDVDEVNDGGSAVRFAF